MTIYGAAKKLWRRIPLAWRHRVRHNPVVAAVIEMIARRTAAHDEVYDAAYFANVDKSSVPSARMMSASIVEEFAPRTVLDVGCGTGALLKALADRGVQGKGAELADAAIAVCRQRGLDVTRFDIERDDPAVLGSGYDVVCSMEVAEHLPEHLADRYVAMLCQAGPVVVLTAAPPGQGGTDHVNEQPNSYWITKFEQVGFALNEETTARWRSTWAEQGVTWFFANNVMVFRRSAP